MQTQSSLQTQFISSIPAGVPKTDGLITAVPQAGQIVKKNRFNFFTKSIFLQMIDD